MEDKRVENAVKRQAFIEVMGLLGLKTIATPQDDWMIDHIHVLLWPKGDDGMGERKFDHEVYMIVFKDGTFTVALDDGHIRIEECQQALHRMVAAAEQKEGR